MNTATAKVIPEARLKLVTELIAAVNALPESEQSNKALDQLAKPLLASLVAEGLITEIHYVEWAGFFEFGLIAIFWSVDEEFTDPLCANVNADGSFEQYR